ncbi:hypothetical protein Pfo_027274 [Paulownia fortunei]|nr:hypothetical protein Pfo_027274 [Paulownia fortunei]
MKKGIPFEWDKSCRNTFEIVKTYLIKPSVLVAPVSGCPLILYIAVQERSIGALLAQENNNGKDSILYYLSRMMMPNELNYSPIEKISNPLKYIMPRPVLSDRLVRWYLQLQQFEIIYVPQKAVKEQVLADFLPDHPIPTEWELSNDLLDKDVLVIEITSPQKMYFDRASHKNRAGVRVIFITSDGEVLPYSFTLSQNCSNNVAEYQALILGLEMVKPKLLPYFNYARRLIGWLGDVVIEHIPRIDNKQADTLANLTSTLVMPKGEACVPICRSWTLCILLKKVIAKSKRDWHERIGEALWAYRTTFRMPTQATPYALVYGAEIIVPLEQQIPSLRIVMQEGPIEEENARVQLEELDALDEKRLEAQQRLECYQPCLSRAFNKKVRSRSFQVGDLMLAMRRPIITTHRTGNKLTSKWDGPYVVKEVYTNGAYKLVAEDGLRIGPINGKS